ncbi:MAG: hypothetical protein LLG06_15415 [Desulfobacteraceae bacterium]|nr:hypothetical protein [Desulfobacteraceae bacterium]
MNLPRITQLKDAIAKTGAAFAILFVLCAGDGSIAYLRHPFNSLDMLPGETKNLTGPMAPGSAGITGMDSESTSERLSLGLEETISGFWMGNKMWRGTLRLSRDIEPGKYAVSVFGREDRKIVGSNVFEVIVYKDRSALLSASKSLLERHAGISPWTVSGVFFGLTLLVCGSLYLVSGVRDRLMAEAGEAEVYHVVADDTGILVYFGLGERNGVVGGTKLILADASGGNPQEITVDSVSKKDGMAKVGALSKVRPGYVVRKI